MKTQKKGLASFLKKIAITSFTTALLVSCGGKNTSGGNTSGAFGAYGNLAGGNGYANFGAILQQVANENPCRINGGGGGGQGIGGRQSTTVNLQGINVNVNSSYVGVTAEGDIAVVHNSNGVAALDMYLCPRPNTSGQGELTQLPVLNTSQECPVGEITAADVLLYANQSQPYYLKFFPIHIPGAGKYSQVCQGYNGGNGGYPYGGNGGW